MGNLLTYCVSNNYYFLTKLLLILGYRYYSNVNILGCARGNEKITKLLLLYGNDDIYSCYAKASISSGCSLNLFKILVQNNANIDDCLVKAIDQNRIDICEYLISKKDIKFIWEPYLCIACENKRPEIVKLLLSNKINTKIAPINTRNFRYSKFQEYVLNMIYCTFISIDLKDLDTLRVFIENNFYGNHEYTMLYYASITGNIEVVEFLLEHKDY